MPAAPSGLHWIAGGAVAAVALPLLAIGVGMPFWIACIVSVVGGGGIAALLAPRRLLADFDASGVERGKIEFARELLTDAEPQVERLETAATAIRAKPIADRVQHLARIARDIFAAIEKDPLRIDRVRRFMTYYLPRAAEIAEAYGALERGSVPDAMRQIAAGELIERLDTAFTRYASNLRDAEFDKLDIEIKLLKSSLDEDIGPAQPGVPLAREKGKT